MPRAEPIDVGLFGSFKRYGDLGVHTVVDVRRTFAPEDVAAALAATITHFPVLGCIYEPRFFRDRWVVAKGPISNAFHFSKSDNVETETLFWTKKPLDPTVERPVRIVQFQMGDRSRFIVSLSHLAVDGAGMAAVGHVFASYLYGKSPRFPVETRRDLGRALSGLQIFHLPMLVRDTLHVLFQPLRVYRSARRKQPYPSGGSLEPAVRHLVFSSETLEKLKAKCGGGVTVNDLLLAAVARAGARRAHSGDVAVHYTMDLRRFSRSPHLSATNASSILSAVIPQSALGDLPTAARTVRPLTQKQRNSLVGPAFVLLPSYLVNLAPHALVRALLPTVHPLAVDMPLRRGLIFTNVGKVDSGLGPLADDIEDVRVYGPNMIGVPAPAIVAFGFRGQLHLELFAPPGLGDEALLELERDVYTALDLPFPG
ncbi:MAG: hypothetical protein IPK82_27075 [Polyangiaceae bacterium]|nr:hypothetical protein [Polyangiaceae bacterium]